MTRPGPSAAGVCEAHGVRHGSGGCPLCRQEQIKARRDEERRVGKLAIGILGPILAAGLAFAVWPRRPPDPRLDPEEYRPAIETLESVLYRAERPDGADRAALSESARALEFALSAPPRSPTRKQALEAIGPFTAGVWVAAERQGELDVLALRRQWEALRAAHFRPASWLRTSSAALEQGQRAPAARGVPADLARYTEALDNLRRLASRVDFTFGRLPESYQTPDWDQSILNEWAGTREEVEQGLDRVKQALPAPPFDQDSSWLRAYHDLERAMRAIGGAMREDRRQPTRLPNATEGRFRSTGIQNALDTAQRSLEAAVR